MILRDYIATTCIDVDLNVKIVVLYLDYPLETIQCEVDKFTKQIKIDDLRGLEYMDCTIVGQLIYCDCGLNTLTISVEELA